MYFSSMCNTHSIFLAETESQVEVKCLTSLSLLARSQTCGGGGGEATLSRTRKRTSGSGSSSIAGVSEGGLDSASAVVNVASSEPRPTRT